MRIVLQRVTDAKVTVEGELLGEAGPGFLALVGFGQEDTPEMPGSPIWKKIIDKMLNLRVFADDAGKFNRSLTDISGDLMVISQFTLYADCRKGRRPSFTGSCPPAVAEPLFDQLLADIREVAPGKVATGQFGAMMDLDFTNSGPVTIILDSNDL